MNQDFQDFQDYRGRLRFKRKGVRKGLLYMFLFAGALRIGEKPGNESTVYNNLTIQTGDLIINPVNPDSKSGLQVPKCNPVKKRVNEVILL